MRDAAPAAAYIRHPDRVATRLCVTSDPGCEPVDAVSAGRGGIRLRSRLAYQPGSLLQVRVELAGRELRYHGLLLWRRRSAAGYELGLGFASERAAFQARMVEQLCHIEAYRQEREAAGEQVDFERAAAQWIARYSGGFPLIGGRDGGSVAARPAQPARSLGRA